MLRKIIYLAVLSLFFMSCASEPEENNNSVSIQRDSNVQTIDRMDDLPSWVFDSTPKNGHPRIVVFTTRRADREEEIERCAQLAAIESARNRQVYVSAKELSQKGNANFGYANDLYIEFNEELAPQLLDDMELDMQVETPEGTFARFIDNSVSISMNYSIADPSNPSWVTSAPEIPGYLVVTGFVERHRNWAESFRAADESAFTQIAYSLFGRIDNQVETIDQSSNVRARTDTLGTIYIQGEGVLEGLLILGRWKDNQGNYYSLAAVPIN